MEESKQLKRKLIQARENIKKKFRAMQATRLESEDALKEVFKPITTSLKENLNNNFPSKQFKPPPVAALNSKTSSDSESSEGEGEYNDEDSYRDPWLQLNIPTSTPSELKKKQKTPLTAQAVAKAALERSSFSAPAKVKHHDTTYIPLTLQSQSEAINYTQDDSNTSALPSTPVSETRGYIDRFMNKTLRKVPYGVRIQDGIMYVGDSEIRINGDYFEIKNQRYHITPGLLELLFEKSPEDSLIRQRDLRKYNAIVSATNLHRRGFSAHGQIQGDRSRKYKLYILTHQAGSGLIMKNETTRKPNYIYWNDVNELVDRLRLLYASKTAGHTGHENEIISIIEELVESGVILAPNRSMFNSY